MDKLNSNGFSTLEVLIAMTVLILTLTSVILISLSNQAFAIDIETNSEALGLGREILEKARATGQKDFRSINPIPEFQDVSGFYTQKLDVETQPDFFTKKLTASISWEGEHRRALSTELSILITDFENAVGGDTCDSILHGDWQHPQINTYSFTANALLPGSMSGKYIVSDVNAYKNFLYVTVNNALITSSSPVLPTFFIFNITNHSQPIYSGSVDNNPTDSSGLNSVAIAEAANGKLYAYVANGYGANFTSCVQARNCAQLQVIDVSNPTTPALAYSYKVSGVTGSGGQGSGNKIYYHNGYVFLGLTKPASGSEFHIIDVHNPLAPFEVSGGTFTVGSTINALFVKDGYAYLATPSNVELTVLDVNDPSHISMVGSYDAPDNQGNGKSIDMIGDALYFGRTITSGHPELYLLNTDDLQNLQSNNTTPPTQEISSSVIALKARDSTAFLLTTRQSTRPGQIQIWRIDDEVNFISYFSSTLPDSGSASQNTGSGNALDCEGNYVYTGSTDSAHNGFLTILTSQQ